MERVLNRLGTWCAAHWRLVAAVWLIFTVALGAAAVAFRAPASAALTIPGVESQRALDLLEREFPAASGVTGTIVAAAEDGETLDTLSARSALTSLISQVRQLPQVVAVSNPFFTRAVTEDRRYALIQVQFAPVNRIDREVLDEYVALAEEAERSGGIRVAAGGEALEGEPEIGSTEAIGVLVAAIVLVVMFGSLIAAGLTMLNALLGVAAGMAGLFALSDLFEMTSTAPVLALMLGLAVGIDYSLFITSRFRHDLLAGEQPQAAAGSAVATAGTAVVFAGATVVVALAGLSVVGIPFLTVMGLAAAGTVVVAVLIALTLLPALLGLAGRRVLPRRHRVGDDPDAPGHVGFGFTWARAVTRFRWPVILAGVVGLGVLALPWSDMRLALPDAGTAAEGSPARETHDLVSEGFGPGFNGRLALVVSSPSAEQTGAALQQVVASVSGMAGVVAIGGEPQFNQSADTALVAIIPERGPSDPATEDLVHRLRAEASEVADAAGPGTSIMLTGITAIGVDVSEKLADALPVFLLVVVGLSILLLGLMFRSLLVPVKAALGFLLTVAATFGATVAVFQWGWLRSLVALDQPGPLISFLPVLLIGILFGLAMDYEVFLVSRMREDYLLGETPHEAVISGVGHGARVVTAAAIIMTSVFGGFVLVEDPIIKSMGFALAIGVAIDAFVVRMAIVPAVMSLLGRWAWWLPGRRGAP